jgi:serine/threonine protein kinase
MPVSVPDFWKLLVDSRLASADQARELESKFRESGDNGSDNAVHLGQWMVSHGLLSVYQAKVLLAGRPGPFLFGEYLVFDRFNPERFKSVFRAVHLRTRGRVLLGFLSAAIFKDRERLAVAMQQVSELMQAVHPNLVRVFDLSGSGEYRFVVLEDLEGQTAEDRLTAGPLDWKEACRVVQQSANGLTQLVELGLIHGDIRPQNIWIDAGGKAKLLLPPLARDVSILAEPINFAHADPSGRVALLIDYAAPELAEPEHWPDVASEIYALGCTLHHLLVGQPPFSEGNIAEKLARHAVLDPTASLPQAVPRRVAEILSRMMAKNAVSRFQHPLEVAEVLAAAVEDRPPNKVEVPAIVIKVQRASPRPEAAAQPAAPIKPPPTPAAVQQAATTAPPPVRQRTVIAPSADSLDLELRPPEPPKRPAQAPPVGRQPAASPLPVPLPSANGIPALRPAVAFAPEPPATVRPTSAAKPATPSRSTRSAAAPVPSFDLPEGITNTDTGLFDTIVAATARGKRKSASRSKAPLIASVVLVLCLLVGFVIVLSAFFKRNEPPATDAKKDAPAVSSTPETNSAAADLSVPSAPDKTTTAASENDGKGVGLPTAKSNSAPPEPPPGPIADDGKTLWTAPRASQPISLDYVASGAMAVLAIRPAELLSHPEAEKIVAALGPGGQAAQRELEAIVGALLPEVKQLIIAWIERVSPDGSSTAAPMYIFRFAGPIDQSKLLELWQNPTATPMAGQDVFATSFGSAYLPVSEGDKVLVAGSAEEVQQAAKQNSNKPPLVAREIEWLVLSTDSERTFSVIFLPRLLAEQRAFFLSTAGDELLEPLRSFLGFDARAAAFSGQLSREELFLELRVLPSLDRSPIAAADEIRKRLAGLPAAVTSSVGQLHPTAYSKAILGHYPAMIRALVEFSRTGIEDRQAIVRCYLPVAAAHNLLMGSELLLAESSIGPSTSGSNGPAKAETVGGKLQHVTSLAFARDTLEKAVQMLADDIGVQVEILGPDLQLEGITKNQSFGLEEKDQRAGEILRKILLKANPDGKLVYVVKPRQPGGEEMLFITTRAAVAKRGDKLPAELAAPPKK